MAYCTHGLVTSICIGNDVQQIAILDQCWRCGASMSKNMQLLMQLYMCSDRGMQICKFCMRHAHCNLNLLYARSQRYGQVYYAVLWREAYCSSRISTVFFASVQAGYTKNNVFPNPPQVSKDIKNLVGSSRKHTDTACFPCCLENHTMSLCFLEDPTRFLTCFLTGFLWCRLGNTLFFVVITVGGFMIEKPLFIRQG